MGWTTYSGVYDALVFIREGACETDEEHIFLSDKQFKILTKKLRKYLDEHVEEEEPKIHISDDWCSIAFSPNLIEKTSDLADVDKPSGCSEMKPGQFYPNMVMKINDSEDENDGDCRSILTEIVGSKLAAMADYGTWFIMYTE